MLKAGEKHRQLFLLILGE